jgi:hypothetical protein
MMKNTITFDAGDVYDLTNYFMPFDKNDTESFDDEANADRIMWITETCTALNIDPAKPLAFRYFKDMAQWFINKHYDRIYERYMMQIDRFFPEFARKMYDAVNKGGDITMPYSTFEEFFHNWLKNYFHDSYMILWDMDIYSIITADSVECFTMFDSSPVERIYSDVLKYEQNM